MLSRAADSLYWLSRYLERAETTSRLIYNHVNLMLGQSPTAADGHWQRLFTTLQTPLPPVEDGTDPAFVRIRHLTFDRENPSSIRSCIATARENARQVREQISSEMWEQINRLYLDLNRTDLRSIWRAQPHEFFREIENDICLFHGITTSTILHDEGWYFLQLGTYLERALQIATLLDIHFSEGRLVDSSAPHTGEYLRWIGLLRSCLAFEAYCRQYTPTVQPNNVAEFLILSSSLPRSLRVCADRVQSSLQQIATRTESREAERLHRLAGRLQARLRYGQIDEILADDIHTFLADITRQCEQIHTVLYQTYIEYAIEGEFAA